MNSVKMTSQKLNDLADYQVVQELPTNFRSYGTLKEVYVRGLFFEESLSLSKFIGNTSNPSYSQLAALYSDVIIGIDIKDLELIDFITLMTISSIWTNDGFGWSPNIGCTKVTDGKKCSGKVVQKINLDDFDFEDPMSKIVPIPMDINEKTYSIGPLTVGNIIEKEVFLESNPEVNKLIVQYALMIKDDISLDEKVKTIRFSTNSTIKDLKLIDKELYIKIKPIIKNCNTCSHPNRLYIGLNQIRGYP